jgi:hypothetical protein
MGAVYYLREVFTTLDVPGGVLSCDENGRETSSSRATLWRELLAFSFVQNWRPNWQAATPLLPDSPLRCKNIDEV